MSLGRVTGFGAVGRELSAGCASDKMSLEARPLTRIIQFGTIKVIPGLANIALIPILHAALGPAGFGQFSIFLSYALLSATVLSAVVTQPMYRFLSSESNGVTRFNGFAVLVAILGGLAGSSAGIFVMGDLLSSALGALFVFSSTMYTALTVRYQIEGAIRTLVIIEALRVVILLSFVAVFAVTFDEMAVATAIFALAASFLIPLLLRLHHLKFTLPEWTWVRKKIHFGYLSAIWLLLAGLPIAFGKSLLAEHVSGAELGAVTANLDMYYRIFSILNIAIAMWAFPAMSAAYDRGDRAGAQKMHIFAMSVYFGAGAIAVGAFLAFAGLYQAFPATMAGGLASFATILIACFLLQAMSLAHKPLEMSQSLVKMIATMALALSIFGLSAFLLLEYGRVNPVIALAASLVLTAVVYLVGSASIGFGKKRHKEVSS